MYKTRKKGTQIRSVLGVGGALGCVILGYFVIVSAMIVVARGDLRQPTYYGCEAYH
jgi:hypothetical protein